MSLTPDETIVATKMKNSFPYFAENVLKIANKAGEVVPFKLNKAQLYLHQRLEKQLRDKGKVRILVVKGRQMGISTYVEARYYHNLWRTNKTLVAFILTHNATATEKLFKLAKGFHSYQPDICKPDLDTANTKELVFSHNKGNYSLATAGSKDIGRGQTINLFHGCLGPDTEILMADRTVKLMRDCEVGDSIVTHNGNIAPISFISNTQKESYSVIVGGNSIPLLSSGSHKFFTDSGWKKLSDMSVDDYVLYPIKQITSYVSSLPFRMPDIKRPQGGGSIEHVPSDISVDYNLGRILGLYLAEGHIRSGSVNRLTFTIHRREVERTISWLTPLSSYFKSFKVENVSNSLTSRIHVNGKSFANMVLELCGRTTSKHLPEIWQSCGEDFSRGILHGYLSGDGHSSPTERRISAPSVVSAITYGIRDICVSLGYGWPSISYRVGGIRNGRNERAQWTLRINGSGVDKLADELGFPYITRKRIGNSKFRIIDGYVHIPVKSITSVGVCDLMDFEVDHADHSYCISQCSVSNSEVAFWDNAENHIASVFQATYKGDGSEIILESTAQGIGNLFHNYTEAAVLGQSEYEVVFLPWFIHDEYAVKVGEVPSEKDWSVSEEWLEYSRLYKLTWEQLYWAYLTNREMANASGVSSDMPCSRFKEEYPAYLEEAFQNSGQSFISPDLVNKARKPLVPVIGMGPVILGIDPARSLNGDDIGIIDRCGRSVGTRINQRLKPSGDIFILGAQIVKIIQKVNPDFVNIDVGGVGAGVYDYLVDKGFGKRLNPVNFGERAIGKGPTGTTLYANRRAEMYDEMRDWFVAASGPVSIPDDPILAKEICAAQEGPGKTGYNSSGQLIIESKDSIKSRLNHSPDLCDALALTFAVPMDYLMMSNSGDTSRANSRRGRTGY